MKKYIQTKNLNTIFDLSPDYFQRRMHKDLIEGKHFFIPPTNSKTKHVVLWNIEAVDNWLRGEEMDEEVADLLKRR